MIGDPSQLKELLEYTSFDTLKEYLSMYLVHEAMNQSCVTAVVVANFSVTI